MDSRENHVLGRRKNTCGGFGVRKNVVCVRGERGECIGTVRLPLGAEATVLPFIAVYLTLSYSFLSAGGPPLRE